MQIFLRPPGNGSRPYGQPGQLPSGNGRLPLLIELKAQFYKLVTLQPVRGYVHQLVKRSIRVGKVVFAIQTLYRKQEAEGKEIAPQTGERRLAPSTPADCGYSVFDGDYR